MLIIFSPMGENHFFCKAIHLIIRQDNELLIGWGINIKLIPFTLKKLFHALCHLVGMTRNSEVKVVSKECFKLTTNQSTFRHERSVLLNNIEKVLVSIVMCEDNCLSTERSLLCPTNIKDVTMV